MPTFTGAGGATHLDLTVLGDMPWTFVGASPPDYILMTNGGHAVRLTGAFTGVTNNIPSAGVVEAITVVLGDGRSLEVFGLNIDAAAFYGAYLSGSSGVLLNLILSGDDTLVGMSAGEQLRGGDGADDLEGGAGDDTLRGEAGDDSLDGGVGSDILIGGAGRDEAVYRHETQGVTASLLTGQAVSGANTDTLIGIENLVGSDYADVLTGGGGSNYLHGGEGDDRVDGRNGDDWLFGGLGADQLTGGAGNDQLVGEDGNDRLTGGAGNDTIYGGAGADIVIYSGAAAAVQVDLETGQASGGDGFDLLIGVEQVLGSNHADLLLGNSGKNRLTGGAGADVLDGRGGDDTLIGGAGDDTFVFTGASGADVVADFAGARAGGRDVLDLRGMGFVSDHAVVMAMTDFAGGVVLTHSGGTITLLGLSRDDFFATDFLLGDPPMAPATTSNKDAGATGLPHESSEFLGPGQHGMLSDWPM